MKDEANQTFAQPKKKHSRKRKRNEKKAVDKKCSNSKKNNSLQPLKGLVLAISTLDVKDKQHSSNDLSYQAVSELCKDLGAQVTGQVHKKVFAVICNRSAVTQLTQRVRKAIKKGFVHLIDVEWIKQCKREGQCVKHEEYLLTEDAKDLIEKRSKIMKAIEANNEQDSSQVNEDVGWTEPISLDCCCVCHEDGRDDCEWCVDCNVTRRAKKLKKLECTIIE